MTANSIQPENKTEATKLPKSKSDVQHSKKKKQNPMLKMVSLRIICEGRLIVYFRYQGTMTEDNISRLL